MAWRCSGRDCHDGDTYLGGQVTRPVQDLPEAARVHDLAGVRQRDPYVNRVGVPWEFLPHDFRPQEAVCYAKWEADGTPPAGPGARSGASPEAASRAAASACHFRAGFHSRPHP